MMHCIDWIVFIIGIIAHVAMVKWLPGNGRIGIITCTNEYPMVWGLTKINVCWLLPWNGDGHRWCKENEVVGEIYDTKMWGSFTSLNNIFPLRPLTGDKLLPSQCEQSAPVTEIGRTPIERERERPDVIETRGGSLEGDRTFKKNPKNYWC